MGDISIKSIGVDWAIAEGYSFCNGASFTVAETQTDFHHWPLVP